MNSLRVIAILAVVHPAILYSQETDSAMVPTAVVVSAPTLEFPAPTDSNSPAFWGSRQGQPLLTVLNSAGHPVLSQGANIRRIGDPEKVEFRSQSQDGGVWMEAVIPDARGVLYGYYHNEPGGLCPGTARTMPRIGAARSRDGGHTWDDLGIILEATAASAVCDSPNKYFAGGFGDFSVILNAAETDLYFFVTAYHVDREHQGVIVGRMLWAERDSPVGHLALYANSGWRLPLFVQDGDSEKLRMEIAPPTPLFETETSWYEPSGIVDALWGPSVHWNTHLKQHVMLLNRAFDANWSQDGVYISFNPVLDDPTRWTVPVRIVEGGGWYPQVIGLETGSGTDKVAGQVARFFVSGKSSAFIRFIPPPEP